MASNDKCAGNSRLAWLGLALAAVFACAISFARADETATPQKLLFDAPYLSKLNVPSALHYSYQHTTSAEKAFGKSFTDTIEIDVGANDNDGGINSVIMRIFTGERQRQLGPHLNLTGNPVIMIFLERDLWEMKQRIGGKAVYYRNRIRRAFRETAKIEKGQAEFDGKTIPVHKVTIKPFTGEQGQRRMQKFLNKSYEFTVGEAVPGGILKVRTVLPADEAESAAIVSDELTFVGVK
ncbi:MAG: hypothetical protein ACR2OM_02100 [Aestuariivirgaceae bacterium]